MKEYESSISKVLLSLTCLFILFACGNGEKYEETASPAAPSYECLNCHGNAAPTDSLAKITDDIIDTHYDNWRIEDGVFVTDPTNLIEGYLFESPLSWAANGLGYFVRTNTASDCAHSCHDYHIYDNLINRQWRASPHADITAEAFVHDWSNSNGVCLRCHSGAGYASYVDSSNTSYPDWNTPTSDIYSNLITCNSCHDGQGRASEDDLRLRKTGYMTLISGSGSTAVNDATINAGNSATCITCHQARESGSSVAKALLNADLITTADLSACLSTGCTAALAGRGFINPHYLPAGAILYGYKGFEFQDMTYSQGITFHQSQGCVGCHMAVSENLNLGGHTLAMEATNALTGEMERHLEVCIPCHGPEITRFSRIGVLRDMDGDGTPDYPSREIRNLRTKVEEKLAEQGIYFNPDAYPYFFNTSNPASQSSSTATKDWTLGQFGAAFNLQLITKEPGSFVHNFRYAVQLLRDSYRAIQGWSCSTTTTTSCSVDSDCPAGETCKILGIRPSTGDDRPAIDYTQLP